MVYERLGFGELKPTKMVLQLADRSTRIPRRMVDDVLIKVGEFIFLVDFVVLETVYYKKGHSAMVSMMEKCLLAIEI